MTREDEDVLLAALAGTGKAAVGSMGDDTPPAAMLDRLPRRLEDHFKLRFAQETSPPIDPIRDSWVFETQVALGDRSGLWTNGRASGPVYILPERILSLAEMAALGEREGVATLDLTLRHHARGRRGSRSPSRTWSPAGVEPGRPRRGDRPLRPRGGRRARGGARAARGEPPPRRAREGGAAPPRRPRGRRRGLGHPALRAARRGGRGRGLARGSAA